MTRLLAIALALGLLVPSLAELARPLLYPSLFLVMMFTLIRIDPRLLQRQIKSQGVTISLIVIIQMVAIPCLLAFIFRILNIQNLYLDFTMLVLCSSTLFGAPAIAALIGQDSRPILIGVIFSTLLLPLNLPLVWWIYNGAPLAVDLLTYSIRLIIFLICPAIIAFLLRQYAMPRTTLLSDKNLQRAAIFALSIFAIAILDGVTARFFTNPIIVLSFLALALSLHFILYALPRHVYKIQPINAAILNAYRNIGLLIAISGPYLPADFFLFAGLWQIPMYLSPWLISILGQYRKPT